MPILLILLIFTICYIFQALQLSAGTFKTIGPGFYPVLISVIMLPLLLIQLFREIRTPTRAKLTVSKFQLCFIAILGAFIFLLEKIGYIAVALLFCYSFSALLGWQVLQKHRAESRLKALLILPLTAALLITGLDYLLFELAFDFHLP